MRRRPRRGSQSVQGPRNQEEAAGTALDKARFEPSEVARSRNTGKVWRGRPWLAVSRPSPQLSTCTKYSVLRTSTNYRTPERTRAAGMACLSPSSLEKGVSAASPEAEGPLAPSREKRRHNGPVNLTKNCVRGMWLLGWRRRGRWLRLLRDGPRLQGSPKTGLRIGAAVL